MTFNYTQALKLFAISLLLFSLPATAQLSVSPGQPAATLAAKLAGNGISISSPTLTCAAVANGTFTSVATPIAIDSGIILTSGRSINTAGLESFLASSNNGMPGDADLTVLAGTGTFDACVLEFDFIPKGDTVSFNYQFGSEEYINSTCGQYNDAFAFFISGPGIPVPQNMALVPGTSIPVTVNSINNGIPGPPGWPGFCNIVNCTSMGPGSPFTSYYIDNTGGTQVTYKGYTRKLTASHAVTPCVSYHLKMAVADASNGLYDSGVFIEAGSLKTNTYAFSRTDSIGHTIAGIPNSMVRGCGPVTFKIKNSRTTATPQKVYLSYGGTAIKGTDFTAPDSATIAPGDTIVTVSTSALPGTGVKTVSVYLSSPFSCGIVDTIQLNILEAPTASISTSDTAVCLGQSFQVHVNGTPGLVYSWTPGTFLSSSSVMEPVITPTSAMTYTMAATLPLSGCAALLDNITVSVNVASMTILSPDTSICIGSKTEIRVTGTPGLSYSWSPATGLSHPTSQNTYATPSITTTYTVSAISGIGGCPALPQTITITVVNPSINITTPNSNVCVGGSIALGMSGDASYTTYSYNWLPTTGLDDATAMEPIATPAVSSVTYTVTATVPGLGCTTTDKVTITHHPLVTADAIPATSICLTQSIELSVEPQSTRYSYSWSGPAGFTSGLRRPFIRYALPVNEGVYSVTLTDNLTGCTGSDTTYITVGNDSLTLKNVTPNQTIKYGNSIQLNADSGTLYTWSPDDGSLDNPNINNPIATPKEKTTYTVYATGRTGCIDTASVTIDVEHDDQLLIPTAFTPNGDGLNDIFRIRSTEFARVTDLSIFNRWGELVFHSSDGSGTGWDGTFNGQPAPSGTYAFMVIFGRPGHLSESRKGDITLIR